MGHRANYCLKLDQSYELFYSHWGASQVHHDFFWGPDLALSFVRSQRVTTEWLDEVWCEGGALLDLPGKKLMLFGAEDLAYDFRLRNVYLKLLKHNWLGWEIHWAEHGILDLAKAVGEAPERVLCDQKLELESGWEVLETASHAKDWSQVLVEVGTEKIYTIENSSEQVLLRGPKLLQDLPAEKTELFLGPNEPPEAGIFIEPETKCIRYWVAKAHPLFHEWMRQAWVGWDIECDQDMAEEHVQELAKAANITLKSEAEILETLTHSLRMTFEGRSGVKRPEMLVAEKTRSLKQALAKYDLE